MWAAHFAPHEQEVRSWISSCGLGTMGYGVPAVWEQRLLA